MSEEQFRRYIETLWRKITAEEGKQVVLEREEIAAALEGLQLYIEEMQTKLEVAEEIEENFIGINQQINAIYLHYYDLFYSSPFAYLVTDANGVILEANEAIAGLLNVPQRYLAGKPLVLFIAGSDHNSFYTKLNQLPQTEEIQHWPMILCPRQKEPFLADLQVMSICNDLGQDEMRIGVYNLSHSQQTVVQMTQPLTQKAIPTGEKVSISSLPQALDGLQVLIVDDEADAREFISAVLESVGIRVRAVGTAAAALEALETFHPDVLVSDIRMPDGDGYSLIRQIRELEARKGWQIRAAAITAYLEEDREKTLSAGFEAHLHKLAQPAELIEMVAQLARRSSS